MSLHFMSFVSLKISYLVDLPFKLPKKDYLSKENRLSFKIVFISSILVDNN